MDLDKLKEYGKLGAKVIRERYSEKYYLNPNLCKNCGEIIHIREGEHPSATRKKKFCNRSCAAQFNNKKFPKKPSVNKGICEECGAEIEFRRLKKGGYSHRKFCNLCLKNIRVANANNRAWHNLEPIPFEEQTKGDVKARNHNTRLWWGNRINSHARKVYAVSGKPKICAECGYSRHVDICHIRDIKDFPDTSRVKEINNVNNLIALCKNHHWELDHGFIDLLQGK